MIRRPPRSTRTDTLFPYTTLFRSHRGYSDVVAARVEGIRAHFALQAPADIRAVRRTAVMRLRLLRDTTRRALTDGHGGGFWLNRCDPMRLFVDRPYLDEAIDRLFGG